VYNVYRGGTPLFALGLRLCVSGVCVVGDIKAWELKSVWALVFCFPTTSGVMELYLADRAILGSMQVLNYTERNQACSCHIASWEI
jgi:hypothetical protein